MNILGLAVATTEHHSACLLREGQTVLAVEEERLNRIKHFGQSVGGRSDSNLISDPTVNLDDLLHLNAVQAALKEGGLSLGDVDAIAVNGLPHRLWGGVEEPALDVVHEGRVHFVPHHLAHAASCYRVSGFQEACVAVVDGRGERNTATLYQATSEGRLVEVAGVPVDPLGTSVGGVYDTASRMIGFGPHGQGAVMALAAFGEPRLQLDGILAFSGGGELVADPAGLQRLLEPIRRAPGDPILPVHAHAARSVQDALVRAITRYLEDCFSDLEPRNLCLAGGVFLNCPLNSALASEERWDRVFVQPAAHDGGTALGAALEVAHRLGEVSHSVQCVSALGPRYSEEEMEEALRRSSLRFERVSNGPARVAESLGRSEIVCLFDGRLEYGPRALGNRSILADPRSLEVKRRLNTMKGRAEWRPFGVILREQDQAEFLECSQYSPFMLFTYPVRKPWRERVPAAVHKDGTTRPQMVNERNPLLMDIVESFEKVTGISMVINTSFNRGGEPIVCSPADAIDSFSGLGADHMLMGPYWVSAESSLQQATAKSV